MEIVIIGSGNTAAVLGRKFIAAGHTILQIASRNASAASELAYEWNTVSTNYFSAVNQNADVYIIAVADDAITEVLKNMKLPDKVVAHTAASVSMDVLKGFSKHYGVFYPLQTLRKDMKTMPDIPVFWEGNDDIARKKLASLAHSIAEEKVAEADADARLKLHVAAVMVSNFPNHLYRLAEEYCRKEGLDFKHLLPLIEETAARIKELSPAMAQTGPAIRHDTETIEKHIALLNNYPVMQKIYKLFTQSIEQSSN